MILNRTTNRQASICIYDEEISLIKAGVITAYRVFIKPLNKTVVIPTNYLSEPKQLPMRDEDGFHGFTSYYVSSFIMPVAKPIEIKTKLRKAL